MAIKGMGQGAVVVTDDVTGAKQSEVHYRCDLIPACAILAVAEVLKTGASKYGDNNWVPIGIEDHLNHALIHIFAWLSSDTEEDHLANAACRLLMALENAMT